MRRTAAILMTAACLAAAACSQDVRKTAHGVQMKADDGSTVRIEVITDNIIHVEAVPAGVKLTDNRPFDNGTGGKDGAGALVKKEMRGKDGGVEKVKGRKGKDGKMSLMVVPQKYGAVYSVSKTDEAVVVKTATLMVTARKADGRVSYANADGTPVTEEIAREFSPIEVDGDRAWTVRQTFSSPDDEAFYGLGQHQADEWNYKGKNEELYQYNTKISVPFIVSSKNYGILWDSNSFLRWGDPRDYQHIGEVFTLYDKNGDEGAITGTYVPAMRRSSGPRGSGGPGRPQSEVLVRRETAINQEYLITPECQKVQGAPDFNFAGSNVTFEGEIEPKESGTFRFLLYYAGYTKVFIDGEQVVPEIWRTAWNPNSHKFAVNLEQGKRVPIRIEWEPDGGTSYCGLRVLSPVEESVQNQMSWWGEMQDRIDYYFIKGDNIDKVISGYRTLTGKAQIMPKWAMGYWQSRERYTNQFELVSTLREFRERGIPIDNIVQDWQYWDDDQWGSHEFNKDRYPRPKEMVDSVHALGGRFMISVWPKFYTNTEHFKEMDEKGWMYRVPVDDNVIDWLGYQQSFYDAYAPGARKLFWDQMYDHLYPIGVDAWWMDASEPNIHDCTDMDYRKAMQGPTAFGSSTEYFNAYALMNAEAIYDGQRSVDNDTRVFLLTRNGFAGLQRYSTASWSGDIGTRWEDMKTQITAGMNYSLSGIPFWGQDIGGFSVENRYAFAQRIFDATGAETDDLKEWRELQARWHQWGVFCPLYRAHGQFPYREPWNIAPEGHPAYETIVAQDRLRYKLMPYIYTLDSRVWFDDYTIMRGLVMDFTDDPVARNIDDEFMFGDAFLVCPVYEYQARSREVYLPEGGWYDFSSGRYYDGGSSFIAAAPFDHIPVFVRAGSIIPSGPDIEYTAQEQDGSLHIMVYGGKDASFTLYEDDGLTYAYENGEYSTIPMKWDDKSRTLTIGARTGSFKGMKETRRITAALKMPVPTHDILASVDYDGTETTIKF